MGERRYDVVLYGASGFTGQQTAHYFASHTRSTGIRWAIAGRNPGKLEAIKAQLRASGTDANVLVANSQDQAAVDAIVSQTRVILTTAGPYALFGDALVDACVRFKTHYVDITGEVAWVRGLIDRYHDRAAAVGVRIIPFCGFDSVPSDLGTFLLVQHIHKELGVSVRQVKAYFQAFGGVNGGTVASLFNIYDSGQLTRMRDPFVLNPPKDRSDAEFKLNQDPVLPQYDADVGTWVSPFFMGPVNTRVVRRSHALYSQWQTPYGPEFTYQEYMKPDRPLAALKAISVTGAMTLFQALMRPRLLRHLFKSVLPQPGAGPSQRTMDRGWFRCELVGLTVDGNRLRSVIYDHGDPGNRVTVKCLCESALCLALQVDALPGGARRGGLLTPATGLGYVLAERLRRAGMTIQVGEE